MTFGVGYTIEDALNRLFPTRLSDGVLAVAPPSPPDVFAAAAYLLQVSGGYHHVQPENSGGKKNSRVLYVSEDMRDRAREVGARWQKGVTKWFVAPTAIQNLWSALWTHRHSRIYVELGERQKCPAWWVIALELMMSADMAAKDEVGWIPIKELPDRWLPVKTLATLENDERRGYVNSIAFETNQDVANVLPKARTPTVGCTLRSLSHHLALLPPRGIARAYWASPVARHLNSSRALNLLLVPFPYAVPAKSFVGEEADDAEKAKWGWFDLRHSWLDSLKPADISNWVGSLVEQAEKDCGQIHGIVLPEMALNGAHYDRLVKMLRKKNDFEILISGLCEDNRDGTPRRGNFVATTMFNRVRNKPTTRIREKHHRWKLDGQQITRYALSSSLNPTSNWWEKLDILSRSLDVFVFRRDSCLTTLICEDLARVDPSQELVRSIGPNLVVALLMDAAQVKGRWPGRYATVLADDPGCSVLTLTSLALVQRANNEGKDGKSQDIALWKDDSGNERSIPLPNDADAVVLSLAGHTREARTMDGRVHSSKSWRYHGQQPVTATCSLILRKRIRG